MSSMIYLVMIANPELTEEQVNKEKEYKNYVDEHRRNVKKAWRLLSENQKVITYINSLTSANSSFLLATVDLLIEAHDMSKYGLDEWEASRRYFYPVDEQEKLDAKAEYDKAWIHHYTTNLHHWNWWAKNGKDKMGLEFVIEMCCDWIAMSIKFGGDAYHWYLDQKDIILGDKQKQWVINILKLFYDIK